MHNERLLLFTVYGDAATCTPVSSRQRCDCNASVRAAPSWLRPFHAGKSLSRILHIFRLPKPHLAESETRENFLADGFFNCQIVLKLSPRRIGPYAAGS